MKSLILVLTISTAALVARAEPLDLKPSTSAAPKLNLSRPPLGAADQKILELRAMGAAPTSVEGRVGGGVASFGVLCGRYAGQDLGGVSAARGYDSQGKFVGGKLAFAF